MARERPISTREDRVAALLADGLRPFEIAAHTGLTTGQVSRAIQNIRKQLGDQAQ
jgi:DNA-binding CsgD family transcriptional regulator